MGAILGMLVMATVGRGPIIAAFEAYDHPLNQIAFKLMTWFPQLPNLATHNLMMALGFALLGFAFAIPVALLFNRQKWWVVGLVILWLNALWAIEVELEVAESLGRPLEASWRLSVLSTYIADSFGAFLGAWAGSGVVKRAQASVGRLTAT